MEIKTRYNNNNIILKDDKGVLYYFSYNSLIAKYDTKKDILTLFKKWDYSQTTLKYLYRFINYYFYDLTAFANKKSVIEKMIKENKIKYVEG